MAANRKSLDEIKRDLDMYVGRRVKLRANRGRRKFIEAEGILEQTYPKVFVVRLNKRGGVTNRMSYSYADVLTSTVEVTVDDKQIGAANM
ncbi:MAG: Veg family protein [Firmicutes bacterium]|nr:Veg family protein [Bacillota bacterium]